MQPRNLSVVKQGTFLYGGAVPCGVRIVHSPIRYSSDWEEDRGLAGDRAEETFYIEFSTNAGGMTFKRGTGRPSLAEAMSHVESMPGWGATVQWA